MKIKVLGFDLRTLCPCHLFANRNETSGTIETIASQRPYLIQTEDLKSHFKKTVFGERSGICLEYFLGKASVSWFVGLGLEREDTRLKSSSSHVILAKFPHKSIHGGH